MDKELIVSRAVLNSRVKPATKREEYYQFTESELLAYTEDIVRVCANIADANHEKYVQYGEALAGIILPNTADLIKNYWGVQ